MRIVAVLESMWDWRQMTSGAGYKEAPRWFRINPLNYSGKRLYKLVGEEADLYVTNACPQLMGSANHHGKPDEKWLRENLELLKPDVLLVCGGIAQKCYDKTGMEHPRTLRLRHPAARNWTLAQMAETREKVRCLLTAVAEEVSGGVAESTTAEAAATASAAGSSVPS